MKEKIGEIPAFAVNARHRRAWRLAVLRHADFV
jgi:hypothetical protein